MKAPPAERPYRHLWIILERVYGRRSSDKVGDLTEAPLWSIRRDFSVGFHQHAVQHLTCAGRHLLRLFHAARQCLRSQILQ